MFESFLYAIFAIFGLGFLVFIHELGHYFVAIKEGMRVEAFSIGFGKALYSWERKGVKWQISMLPFGGYVKIAGMQKEGSKEPSEIVDGFFGKTPWARIRVALAGPLVNFLFAGVVFSLVWLMGGREKPFAEFTHRIGWVDPSSPLYEKGVRPGDVIDRYDGKPFRGFKDLMIASLMESEEMRIQGHKIDYATDQSIPFDYTLKTYEDPRGIKEKISTIGVVFPAQYLIYRDHGAPLGDMGLFPGDRLLWADGEILFSAQQLSNLINESSAFLTVRRGETLFQTKVPRIQIDDLKMSSVEKAELDDWQHEAHLKGKLQDLFFIPYTLSPRGFVETRLQFIDPQDQLKAFEQCRRCGYFNPLQEGDQIIAIDAEPIENSYDLLEKLQTKKTLLIVDRDPLFDKEVLWTQADHQFDAFSTSDLHLLISSIGTPSAMSNVGKLHLTLPMTPKPLGQIPWKGKQNPWTEKKEEIEALRDPQERASALADLEAMQKKLVLGLSLSDREVRYNPSPIEQFGSVFQDTWRTLMGLVSGMLKPKYVSGPIGIVHAVHNSWMIGAKEALFWMAVISLNLGVMNLLPIPVLDGGHILFSLVEWVTRKPLKAKTMEKLVIPFVGLMIGLFIYITYQDLTRLFSKFF